MEKRHYDFIDNFSTAKSPQQMLGVLAKTYYAEKLGIDPSKIYMVSIMPCTAKKYELSRTEEMRASGWAPATAPTASSALTEAWMVARTPAACSRRR